MAKWTGDAVNPAPKSRASSKKEEKKETKADADDVEFDPFADNDGDDEATAA